jgi:indolepyruvate ferredoxin oxidoreductase beta subunit
MHRDGEGQEGGGAKGTGRGSGAVKFDIILCGVGGQGVLSVSAVIASAAMDEGLHVKQSEVHGMAQRGGAVSANLRISDREIASDLVPAGRASLVLGMEPMESLRYLAYLSPDGRVITSTTPVTNIENYPPIEELLAHVRRLPHATLVDSETLARKAGSVRATNMVMVGAASRVLPIAPETLERCIANRFGSKGQDVVDLNLRAFRAGREGAA